MEQYTIISEIYKSSTFNYFSYLTIDNLIIGIKKYSNKIPENVDFKNQEEKENIIKEFSEFFDENEITQVITNNEIFINSLNKGVLQESDMKHQIVNDKMNKCNKTQNNNKKIDGKDKKSENKNKTKNTQDKIESKEKESNVDILSEEDNEDIDYESKSDNFDDDNEDDNENDDCSEESNILNSINYYNLDKTYFENDDFIDYINDVIFYIGISEKNGFIIKNEIIQNLVFDLELFLLICFIIKVKGLKIHQSIEYIKSKIDANKILSVLNDKMDLEIIKTMENEKIEYHRKLDEVINGKSIILPYLLKYESVCFVKDEFTYKCSSCRKNIFKDNDLEFYHKYTPKLQYSFKRYKKSFVNKAECSSYFLKNVEKIFVVKKDNLSKSKSKYSYEYEDFYSTKMSTKLNCLNVSCIIK